MKHIISVLVENKFGVLARISGLFSARGFNINSLAVGETEDPDISRMTVVVKGDDKTLDQVKKQLNKLIDVISVKDFVKKEHIDRELLLFKVNITKDTKDKVAKILDKQGAKIIKTTSDDITVEVVGDEVYTQKLLDKLVEFGIKEMVRTGRIAMAL
ncbi:MAG: acetolactate synthase small subunit [Candidatus Omnitrophica bacterium]|nr:acetolactate synthase small subunit [Candidatus Omnitrophota bacterium]